MIELLIDDDEALDSTDDSVNVVCCVGVGLRGAVFADVV